MENEVLEQLAELRRQYQSDRVSVMVGAGFSKNACPDFPSWNELLKSGGQELLYKPLDTIYSLRSCYLSVVYIEKRFSITSSISCLGVQAASPHGLAR